MFNITEYIQSDCDGCWELHQATVSGGGFVKNPAFDTDIRDIPHVYEAFFVIRDSGKIIGMVGLKRIDDHTLEIKRLQVDTAHRGLGLGKQLMEHALNYVRKFGASRCRLDVSQTQTIAYKLYTSLGFNVTHIDEQILGPDNEKFLSTYMEKEVLSND